MKKLLFSLAAIVALFATSCVTEANSNLSVSGEETVTFSIKTANIGTRSYNDGLKATQLTYAVYDKDWKHVQTFTTEFENGSLEKQISLRLVKNKTYNFVFWAQNPNVTCYTLDLETENQMPSVSIDYSNLASNNDNLDAFFGQEPNFKVDGTNNGKTITLKRPFAQINFGTNDLEAAKNMGYDIANATVSFKTKAYNKFYLNDGAVDGALVDVNFTAATPIDTDKDTKSLATNLYGSYHWVSMNYILWANPDVPADASKDMSLPVCEITLNMANQEPIVIEVPGAPVRRNWRTNLVGLLLTEDSAFSVIILPEPENNHEQNI